MYWILAILLFGVVVLVHELGHFWAARLTGVGVMEFAVGWGPKLWSHKAKSGVTYSVRVLPFGGYCRFVDEEDEGQEDRPDAYYKQKIWKRVLISVSGPLMNVMLAFLLLLALFLFLPINSIEPTIGGLIEGLPAQSAGIQVGDRLVSVNGVETETVSDISREISAAGEMEIALGVERDGERLTFQIVPQWVESEGRSMIGIEYTSHTTRFGVIEATSQALQYTGKMSVMIIEVLRDLIFKGEGVSELSGPIGTVVAIKEQTEVGGWVTYLQLAALISVNLGLFNMLPVPGLDGSKLIFLAIEKIRGKRMDPNKEGLVLLIGFGLLIVLMVIVMYQDIVRLLQ